MSVELSYERAVCAHCGRTVHKTMAGWLDTEHWFGACFENRRQQHQPVDGSEYVYHPEPRTVVTKIDETWDQERIDIALYGNAYRLLPKKSGMSDVWTPERKTR